MSELAQPATPIEGGPVEPWTFRPIPRRVLDRLGRPAWLWAIAWGTSGPLVYAVAGLVTGRQPARPPTLVAWACASVASIWVSLVIARRLETLRPVVARLAGDPA